MGRKPFKWWLKAISNTTPLYHVGLRNNKGGCVDKKRQSDIEGKPTGFAGMLVWSFEAVLLVFEARLHVFFDFRDVGMLNVVETGSFF